MRLMSRLEICDRRDAHESESESDGHHPGLELTSCRCEFKAGFKMEIPADAYVCPFCKGPLTSGVGLTHHESPKDSA